MKKNYVLCVTLVMGLISMYSGKIYCQQLVEDPWSIPLTISVGGNDKELYFGTKVGATDDYDGAPIDTLAPPPPPQGLYTYFQVNGIPNITGKLAHDYKSTSKSPNTWTLKINGTNGSSGTITWDSSDFPTGSLSPGSLTIGGDDMLVQNSKPITGDQTLTINYTAPTEPAGLVFRVERTSGDVYAKGAFTSGGADLAERIQVSEPVEPGDVVELDPDNPQHYRKARGNSKLIAGVITTEPGFVLGNSLVEGQFEADHPNGRTKRAALALMGRVLVKVTVENGKINPGDFLTISNKPGFATRCKAVNECSGVIIGKALEPLDKEDGLILVLVSAR